MDEKTKARIMDATKVRRVLARVATEIIETNRNLKSLVIVGVKTRGVAIGKRLARLIAEMDYRDDVPVPAGKAAASQKGLGFPVVKKDVLLVDDVLMTGRTIRAAMDALIDTGRPQTVQLAVLIDRGHRELPIRPDYVGKVLPTSRREVVRVRLKETDGHEEVLIAEPVKIGGGRKR
ncbi:MAG: bifunctional pyr operon transcriptional regulator/uracil phosphoribosyltransferase PyrR [Acidobacteria bacterium]|nr:bifunctional pyr operon transcriptional regulator/uracil phosphoribosyltransferase PyrR [Acidobacteriota bacterium]